MLLFSTFATCFRRECPLGLVMTGATEKDNRQEKDIF